MCALGPISIAFGGPQFLRKMCGVTEVMSKFLMVLR